ncbi:hypothetical protein DKX38_029100 [Salix brachista]|uniref:Uncharacterized protein n=1 Tax=Salix brachista TaxID=2182728 RepID=A0A5N5IZW4_9ROSI|nr:hypothetical protein DKX38_029100 [Salix brachista]
MLVSLYYTKLKALWDELASYNLLLLVLVGSSDTPKTITFLKIDLGDMTPMVILSIVVTMIVTTIMLKLVISCMGIHKGINFIVVTEKLPLQPVVTPTATGSMGVTMVEIMVHDKHQKPIKWIPIPPQYNKPDNFLPLAQAIQ